MSPVTIGGRYVCFIASVPWWITGPMPKIDRCSVEAAFIAPALPATARKSAPAWVTPRPAPPYCSGISTPTQPAAAKAL